MISTRLDDDNTLDEYLHPHDRREQSKLPLTDEQTARQMRDRRRQLLILRRMIAQREGRSDGR